MFRDADSFGRKHNIIVIVSKENSHDSVCFFTCQCYTDNYVNFYKLLYKDKKRDQGKFSNISFHFPIYFS